MEAHVDETDVLGLRRAGGNLRQVGYEARQIEGTRVPKMGTKTIDLRGPKDGKGRGSDLYERLKGRPKQLAQQRACITELAESKDVHY